MIKKYCQILKEMYAHERYLSLLAYFVESTNGFYKYLNVCYKTGKMYCLKENIMYYSPNYQKA